MDFPTLATAFSTHDYDRVLPHLADDVVWEQVGGDTFRGREKVAKVVDLTQQAIATATVTVREVRAIAADGAVVVDTLTHYDHPEDGVSLVASVDIYDHAGEAITRIRSYTVEVDD